MITTETYRPINSKATYDIFVTELFDAGEYRVNLYEEGVRLTECFDLKLARPGDRRHLEQYVANMREQLPRFGNVWFGKSCQNHYGLADYIRKSYGKEYMSDINI